ncbi:MAG: hypothetical protein L3J05_01260 [Robiginitomaculum sp.]|nr:hypothetical protein [Robiginitomaculum sp.]
MYVDNYAVLKAGGMSAESVYEIISKDAVRLGGRLNDMPQRAVVYHHIYVMSGGNFIFPLIAAHGALWARWYLFVAKLGANMLAIVDRSGGTSRRTKMKAYHEYVNAFKKINRKVMAASYTAFHFTRLYGDHEFVTKNMPKRLVTAFLRCHQMSTSGTPMPLAEQRQFYEDYFRWEQINVVGPAISDAIDNFHWPLAKWFCLRPWVWFSYFRFGRSLIFKDFNDAEERTQKGLAAFDWAAKKSWDKVEDNLTNNPFFPKTFSFDTNAYFADLGMAPITNPQ